MTQTTGDGDPVSIGAMPGLDSASWTGRHPAASGNPWRLDTESSGAQLQRDLDDYFKVILKEDPRPLDPAIPARTFPVVIGACGHADIPPGADATLRTVVDRVLRGLCKRFGTDAIHVMTGFAPGADRLVAAVADELRLPRIAVLPRPHAACRANVPPADLPDFDRFWNNASLRLDLPEVPCLGTTTPPAVLQREQWAALISRYAHVLLALWDGQGAWSGPPDQVPPNIRGTTPHLLFLRHSSERNAEGFRRSLLFRREATRLDLTRPGAVLQIATPAQANQGAPTHAGPVKVRCGDCILLCEPAAADGGHPRAVPLTAEALDDLIRALRPHDRAATADFMRLDQLNRQIREFRARDIDVLRNQLDYLRPKDHRLEPDGEAGAWAAVLRTLQASADTAAQNYQRRLLGEWEADAPLHRMLWDGLRKCWKRGRVLTVGALPRFVALVPATVLMFSLYAHIWQTWWALALYVALVLYGVVHFETAVKPERWQACFQDYRALAEAMRVQLFWALAAMPTAVSDHYLRMQRNELGWIQFALRGPALWATATALVLRTPRRALVSECWLADQRSYFLGKDGKPGKAHTNAAALARSQTASTILVFVSLGCSSVLVVATLLHLLFQALGYNVPNGTELRDWLLVAIAAAPALAAMFYISRERRAYEAQAHAYHGMGTLFSHAMRQSEAIAPTAPDSEYQDLIFDLGREALAENTQWLEEHRRRPVEHTHY